ncbi:hypothetical protein C4D60_Mb11t17640 [Musa balbisiana]|uniref:Protein LURP-one-related 8 n=1 Tax=Musa balbisiana TaxID=52838 RepID=A0A4S8J515_MUSBA|nr:hypothetical protein C4D60_Mb11t17640 [Musa balbisiana]
MTKVHPSTTVPDLELPEPAGARRKDTNTVVLTVWRKSLLFSCSGFTVFDAEGNLVFRVDNYGSGSTGEIVLMDAAGKPLRTIRRKKLSLGANWVIYDGEDVVDPLFSVKKHSNLLHSKVLAHVTTPCRRRSAGYEVEGSYSRRSCTVYDEMRRSVAEIRRKEAVGGVAFGGDVFRLVVHADVDTCLAMAILIVLDQMFGSRVSLIDG